MTRRGVTGTLGYLGHHRQQAQQLARLAMRLAQELGLSSELLPSVKSNRPKYWLAPTDGYHDSDLCRCSTRGSHWLRAGLATACWPRLQPFNFWVPPSCTASG